MLFVIQRMHRSAPKCTIAPLWAAFHSVRDFAAVNKHLSRKRVCGAFSISLCVRSQYFSSSARVVFVDASSSSALAFASSRPDLETPLLAQLAFLLHTSTLIRQKLWIEQLVSIHTEHYKKTPTECRTQPCFSKHVLDVRELLSS